MPRGSTGKSDRVVDHFEFLVGKETIRIPVRLYKTWKGWDEGGWKYKFRCAHHKYVPEIVEDTDIQRLKEKVRVDLEEQLLSVNFEKYFLVKIRGTGHLDKQAVEADAGLEYSEIWLGKLPDGSPCYKESEKGQVIPRELELHPKDEWDEGWVTKAVIPATPANEKALKLIMEGLVSINDRMRKLLGQEKIQETLLQFSVKQLMPPEESHGKKKR